jgi:hypothetical protein
VVTEEGTHKQLLGKACVKAVAVEGAAEAKVEAHKDPAHERDSLSSLSLCPSADRRTLPARPTTHSLTPARLLARPTLRRVQSSPTLSLTVSVWGETAQPSYAQLWYAGTGDGEKKCLGHIRTKVGELEVELEALRGREARMQTEMDTLLGGAGPDSDDSDEPLSGSGAFSEVGVGVGAQAGQVKPVLQRQKSA